MYNLAETKDNAGYTPVPAASVPAPVLGDQDPRYRCLCGLMHAKTGVLVIAVAECLFFVAFTAAAIVGFFGQGVNVLGIFMLICLPAFTVCALMAFGIKKRSRYFLVPHMTLQGLMIFACVVSAVIFLINIAGSQDSTGTAIYTVATILCVSFSAIQLWFLYVIWLAFKYLADW